MRAKFMDLQVAKPELSLHSASDLDESVQLYTPSAHVPERGLNISLVMAPPATLLSSQLTDIHLQPLACPTLPLAAVLANGSASTVADMKHAIIGRLGLANLVNEADMGLYLGAEMDAKRMAEGANLQDVYGIGRPSIGQEVVTTDTILAVVHQTAM